MVLMAAALLGTLPAGAQDDPAAGLWELYKQGQFEEVIRQGKALLNTGATSPQIELAVGRSLVDLGRPDEGQVFLERAVTADQLKTWVYAWGQIYLGQSYCQLGQWEQAQSVLVKARDSRATENSTRTARNTLRGLGMDEYFQDWVTFKSPHFIFHFSSRLENLDRAVFARAREEAYATISNWFGGGPKHAIHFFVWADQAEATAAGMPVLGFSRPEFFLVQCLVQQTVGHEMTHVISHHAVEPTRTTGLINEGIAIVHDQTGRDTMSRARQAVAAGLAGSGESAFVKVGIRALWLDFSLLDAEYTYPLAGAWVDRLLAKGSKEKFLTFISDQSYANALAVYGAQLDSWLEEFEGNLFETP